MESDKTDEETFIPFSDSPTVSRFGPISRTTKTKGRQGEPIQAVADEVSHELIILRVCSL